MSLLSLLYLPVSLFEILRLWFLSFFRNGPRGHCHLFTYLYDAKRFVAISPDFEERNGIRAEKRPAKAKEKSQKKRDLPLQGTGRVKAGGALPSVNGTVFGTSASPLDLPRHSAPPSFLFSIQMYINTIYTINQADYSGGYLHKRASSAGEVLSPILLMLLSPYRCSW